MANRLKNALLPTIPTISSKPISYSHEQQLYRLQIHSIEAERLRKTFNRICGNSNCGSADQQLRNENQQTTIRLITKMKDRFDRNDVARVLDELGFGYSRAEIQHWIWEVDEDLDGCINQYQFNMMYKRCIFDKTALEPRNLFNLVQFLMYDQTGKGKITLEDTLQLIYVRHPGQLDEYLEQIFERKQKTQDDQQRQMLFEQYLSQMRKTDLRRRRQLEQERRTVTKPKSKKQIN